MKTNMLYQHVLASYIYIYIYVYIYVGMYMCKGAPKYMSIHNNIATYIHIRIYKSRYAAPLVHVVLLRI